MRISSIRPIGLLITLVFLYSEGKSPVPAPSKGFSLIICQELSEKSILTPTDEITICELQHFLDHN